MTTQQNPVPKVIVFSPSKEEYEKAVIWIDKHVCKHRGRSKGAIGGGITWEFTPTSIGDAIKVKCTCGEECDVTDYESW